VRYVWVFRCYHTGKPKHIWRGGDGVGVGLRLGYGVAETTHMEKYWEPPP
jgi:hypothetical protein